MVLRHRLLRQYSDSTLTVSDSTPTVLRQSDGAFRQAPRAAPVRLTPTFRQSSDSSPTVV